MSDEALSRWIAEKLEPLSLLPPLPDELVVGDHMPGPTCWIAVQRYSEGDIVRWQFRDMIHDPVMTVMLITNGATSVQFAPSPCEGETKFCAYKLETEISQQGNGPGRAIAEAFALSKGIERELATKRKAPPSGFMRGGPLRWRLSIVLHDCIGHPISGLLWLLNVRVADYLGHWLHDKTMYKCGGCGVRFDDSECPECHWDF